MYQNKLLDLIFIWKCMQTDGNQLLQLAICILSVIADTATTEHNFSNFGIAYTKIQNQLSVESVHKAMVVKKHLQHKHAALSLLRPQKKCKLDAAEPPTADVEAPQEEDEEDHSDFIALGETLIRDANEEDNAEEEDMPVPTLQPIANACRHTDQTWIPLQDLFKYLSQPSGGDNAWVGLDFYWKEVMQNVQTEVEVSELRHQSQGCGNDVGPSEHTTATA
jgi:hypothetical protein